MHGSCIVIESLTQTVTLSYNMWIILREVIILFYDTFGGKTCVK